MSKAFTIMPPALQSCACAYESCHATKVPEKHPAASQTRDRNVSAVRSTAPQGRDKSLIGRDVVFLKVSLRHGHAPAQNGTRIVWTRCHIAAKNVKGEGGFPEASTHDRLEKRTSNVMARVQ